LLEPTRHDTAISHSLVMRVVASEPAVELIGERGGRVYVWLKTGRCCGAVTTLVTASEPPAEKTFRQVDGPAGFALFLDARLGRVPDELHLDVRRWPRRVEAYWNGCAWVT
jgi:hypothetical protein